MIMIDQSKRLSEPLRWGKREKAVVAALLSALTIAIAVLVVVGLTNGSAMRRDCVAVNFASTLGGAELKGCGPQARKICQSGHDFHSIEPELRAACRRAGYPFG